MQFGERWQLEFSAEIRNAILMKIATAPQVPFQRVAKAAASRRVESSAYESAGGCCI
jgi:histone H3/H4